MLLLYVVRLGILVISVVEKFDCDDADVDDERKALLLWLGSEDFEFIFTIGNEDNNGGDNDWVGGNSSYVNGGTLRCGDIFGKNEVTVTFECSLLWLAICWDGNREAPLANDVG